MRTAFCFTPDRTFFPPAVRAIASLLDAEPDEPHEIFLVCEPEDVTPGFEELAPRLRNRINLVTLDFSGFDASLQGKGRFSRAVFRRLFLDQILPPEIERIVTVDTDMLIVRPGLSRLGGFDLGGRPLAAAYGMIRRSRCLTKTGLSRSVFSRNSWISGTSSERCGAAIGVRQASSARTKAQGGLVRSKQTVAGFLT